MRRLKNTSTTNRIPKAHKPGQWRVRKHNESVIGEEIGSEDLLIATPKLHYNEVGDSSKNISQQNPACALRRSKTV